MNQEEIIKKIKNLTTGYKGEDDLAQRLRWLEQLLNSCKRYLPSRVVEKIMVDPSAKKVEGERRNITVVFADLSGFTALSETMDAEDIADIINDFFTRMLKIVTKYEGSVDKFLGDALMVLFGAPIAHHDDPERAIRASLEMQEEMKRFNEEHEFEEPLAMSIGINTGPAVALNVGSEERMEYTVIGDTVNLSARLEKVAQAGEIVISDYTYQHIADVVDAEKRSAVRVKGKRKPVKIFLIKEASEHFRLPDTTKLKMIGRKEELKTIGTCLEDTANGRGTILGMVGDPGTGKTRLALEALARAQARNFAAYTTRCMPYEINTPYTAIMKILNNYFGIKKDATEEERRLLLSMKLKGLGLELDFSLPYLGLLYGLHFPIIDSIPPDELKKRIFDVVKRTVFAEARNNPLCLRVEDLQWCDPTSHELFDLLVQNMASVPLLLIFEYRSDFAFSWLTIPFCRNITLKNFTREEAQTYSEHVLEVMGSDDIINNAIYGKSQGNPLFVQEIVKYLLKKGGIRRYKNKAVPTNRFKELEIAESISGVILAQIDRMPEITRHILQYASVLGKVFQTDLLSCISQITEDNLRPDLERLEHFEGILTSYEEADRVMYEFISPTTYEVVYGSLFKARRKELHTLIGATIENKEKDQLPEFLEQLAYHYTRSNNEEKGIHYANRAAEKSYYMYALKESFNFYQQALDLLKSKKLDQEHSFLKLAILRRYGLLLRIFGDFEGAIRNQKRSLRLAHAMDSPKDEAATHLNIGILYQEMGVPQKGLNYWTRARRIAKKIDDKKIQVLAVNNLGTYFLHIGDLDRAAQYFSEVVNLSEAIQDMKGTALANLNLGNVAERQGDLENALAHYQRAYSIFEELDDKENITRTLNMLGVINMYLGNMDESMRKLNEAIKVANEIGDKATESNALGNIGLVHAQMWQLNEAYDKFSQSLTIAQMIGEATQTMGMNINIGDIFQYRGDITSATDYHNKALDIAAKIQDPANEAIARRSLAYDHLLRGDFKPASQEFSNSSALFEKINDRRNSAISTIGLASVYVHTGAFSEVENIAADFEARAREHNDPEILAHILDIKVDLLTGQGKFSEAKSAVEEIPDLSRKIGNKRLYAWALGKMAYVQIMLNYQEQSRSSLEQSNKLAQAIGEKLLATYNLMTEAKGSFSQSRLTDGINALKQASEQARQAGAKDYLARILLLSARTFGDIGKIEERDRYLAEYDHVIATITAGFSEEEKSRYKTVLEEYV